jgi:hypothetical protein
MGQTKYHGTLCVSIAVEFLGLYIRFVFHQPIYKVNGFSNATGDETTKQGYIVVTHEVVTYATIRGVTDVEFRQHILFVHIKPCSVHRR